MPIRIVSPPLCPGFDMVRSGRVPSTIAAGFLACMNDILNGGRAEDFLHLAVPGGARFPGCCGGECRLPKGTAYAVPRQIAPPVESMLFEAAGR